MMLAILFPFLNLCRQIKSVTRYQPDSYNQTDTVKLRRGVKHQIIDENFDGILTLSAKPNQETRQCLDAKYLKKNFLKAARAYQVYILEYTGSEFFG